MTNANLNSIDTKYVESVIAFLRAELKLGKRYVLLQVYNEDVDLGYTLAGQVHLVCALTPDAEKHFENQQRLGERPDFILMNATPDITGIDEDSIDCVLIDEALLQFETLRVAKELERILRLNSYVIFTQKRLSKEVGGTTTALAKWLLKQTNQVPRIIAPLAEKSLLIEFFITGVYSCDFNQTTYLNKKQWMDYIQEVLLENLPPQEELETFFDQNQKDGLLKLDFKVHYTYGLFNKYVPEISLRKSIFFNILRPFAFGFYILVKANIYFWKFLYKIKEKLFG